jgi:uncharacterized Zn-binding protein involved in type VI secretion
MGQPAARVGDMIKQDAPHCHTTHPTAPVAHPGLPLAIIPPGSTTVLIDSMPAARATDQSQPCMLPGCAPGGPGMIAKGSTTVMIDNLPAARANDMTAHTSCVAPIPAPVGKVMPPCSPTVQIG